MSLFGRLSSKPGIAGPALIGASTAALALLALPALPANAAADPESAAGQAPDPVVRAMARDAGISNAAAEQRLRAQDRQGALADRLTRHLDERAAGAYIDTGNGTLVINVTDRAAAQRVRDAGARARVVEHSMGRLQQVKSSLQEKSVTGATLAIDVTTNEVTLSIPRSKAGARTQELIEYARSFQDTVRIERPAGMPSTQAVYGGEAIYGGGYRCSVAFAATSGGTEYLLTAGHCTDAVSSWSVDEGSLGPTVASSFPGNDYGLVRNDGGRDLTGQVLDGGSGYEITNTGNPPVGTFVCKTGSTTDTTCGTILQYDVTVNYPSGTVGDLIETDVCTQSGDSGGALYTSGNQAVGIVSGGTTIGCGSSFFRAYFENASEALNAYGLSVL